MTRIKKLASLMLTVFAAGALYCQAEEITVMGYTEDGQETGSGTIVIDGSIVFGKDGIQVLNAGSQQTSVISYEGIDHLSFMGVDAVRMTKADSPYRLRENPVETELAVLGFKGEPTDVKIYDMAGKAVENIAAWRGENINVAHLSPGIYLLAIEKTIIKFVKK